MQQIKHLSICLSYLSSLILIADLDLIDLSHSWSETQLIGFLTMRFLPFVANIFFISVCGINTCKKNNQVMIL